MRSSSLEHIRTQAVVVARFTGSEDEGRMIIKEALKEHPNLIGASLAWFELMMSGLTKEQVTKWKSSGFNIMMDGVPFRTFGNLWEYLDRLDEESDNVFVLEDLENWSDSDLADIWNKQQQNFKSDLG